MFRRQPYDKVNPRHVMPSRHTIFIRGLPGSSDVTKVKEYFSTETNSKCSVDFFSTSEDKKRLSVAIRFKSHDVAREMLMKYNNKPLLGFPVEITWFKDLKKARAKMFEEQRQNGNRMFQRQGFRGGFRGNDRRTIVTSPDDFDTSRRMRAGSSSSGGNMGSGMARPKYSRSRSRSFSGSSSGTGSRSISGSPHSRRTMPRNPAEDIRGNVRGFSDGQPGSFGNRQASRNFSCRSGSISSSSSRSSPGMRLRHGSATGRSIPGQKSQSVRYQHTPGGDTSPLNYVHSSRKAQRLPGSPESGAPDYTFSNAPAPDADGGSSLVSGLIQLKRRNQPDLQDKLLRHDRRASVGSTSSGISGDGSRGNVGNAASLGKHIPSISPPFNRSAPRSFKSHKGGLSPDREPIGDDDLSEFRKQKRRKLIAGSPDSLSPPTIKAAYLRPSKSTLDSHGLSGQQSPPYDQSVRSHMMRDAPLKTLQATVSPSARETVHRRSGRHRSPSAEVSLLRSSDARSVESERWAQTRRASTKKSKTTREVNDSHVDSSESDRESRNSQKLSSSAEMTVEPDTQSQKPNDSKGAGKEDLLNETRKDTLDLIRQRKEELAQDYKRDCDAFTVVVRTLISKDAELEGRLMPMLKEILHERGQRCIEELRTFIASTQSESGSKSETMEVSAA